MSHLACILTSDPLNDENINLIHGILTFTKCSFLSHIIYNTNLWY